LSFYLFNNKRSQNQLQYWVARVRQSSVRHKFFSRHTKIKILGFLATLGFALIFLGLITGFAVIAIYSKDLPQPDRLTTRQIPQTTKIYSKDNVLLYEIFGDQRRTLVNLSDIPQSLKDATVATEDAQFYKHQGFDWRGIARAAGVGILKRTPLSFLIPASWATGLQGGSTITQQLVKNTLLTTERTMSRKIKEFILSIEIERRYTKDEILKMYLNEAPYGGQAWGVGAAADMYFGKNIKDLTLSESAVLAGLPQSPSSYSPFGLDPTAWKGRQTYVLYLMQKHGFITKEQEQKAKSEEIKFVPLGQDIKAPHFVMYVKSLLAQTYGEKLVEQGGLKVITTLDYSAQKIAEEEVKKQVDSLTKQRANASNAGLLAINPKTGEVVAWVGSRDYFDQAHAGNVDIILANRQPGSAIKPIMYTAAFKMGYTPATYLGDIQTCFPGGANLPDYCPQNWDSKFWGPMLVREALSNSRNIPAVKMLQMVGVENMMAQAKDLGINTFTDASRYGLSLTLGGGEVKLLELTQAYAVFAAMGVKHDLTVIEKVEDSKGNVLEEFKPSSGQKVLDSKYAYLINNILSDSSARSRTFGNSLEIGRTAAIKTGTTNDNRDAWTFGYTPSLVTGVWVGNFDNSSMNGIMGSTGATPIWKNFTQKVLVKTAKEDWERPDGIVDVTVDVLSGKIPQAGKNYPTKKEIFAKGTEPTQIDDFHLTAQVCKTRNLLATDWDRKIDNVQIGEFKVLRDISPDWQKYTDAWMNSNGFGPPPTQKCPIVKDGQVVTGPVVQITAPVTNEEISSANSFEVKTNIYSDKTVTRVEFYLDNSLIDTVTSIPYNGTYSLDKSTTGEHEIEVRAYDSDGNSGIDRVKVVMK